MEIIKITKITGKKFIAQTEQQKHQTIAISI